MAEAQKKAESTKAPPKLEERPLPAIARRALTELFARHQREYAEAMQEVAELMDLAPGSGWQLDAERMVLVRMDEG